MISTRTTINQRFDHSVSDRPLAEVDDFLNRGALIDSMAAQVHSASNARVVGLYGSWGAGKSHVLSLLAKRLFEPLDGEPLSTVALFNPWHYEAEGDLASGLIVSLATVGSQFADFNPSLESLMQAKSNYRQIAKRLLTVVGSMGSMVNPILGTLGTAAAGAIDGEATADRFLKPRVDEIHGLLTELVQEVVAVSAQRRGVGPDDCRVVVLIDDLDRCSPEKLVSMLEWLKVYLTVPNCTYVVALDHVAAARAIVGRYKEYLGDDADLAYGFRYLEKVVDVEFELSASVGVQTMALSTLAPGMGFRVVSDFARQACGGDFPGIIELDAVLQFRSLSSSRTMLKIVSRFSRCLDVLQDSGRAELVNRLPASYPFWVLWLCAIYYRLDPSSMDEFLASSGPLWMAMMDPSQAVGTVGASAGPMEEFLEYGRGWRQRAGESMDSPEAKTLADLGRVVRELSW